METPCIAQNTTVHIDCPTTQGFYTEYNNLSWDEIFQDCIIGMLCRSRKLKRLSPFGKGAVAIPVPTTQFRSKFLAAQLPLGFLNRGNWGFPAQCAQRGEIPPYMQARPTWWIDLNLNLLTDTWYWPIFC